MARSSWAYDLLAHGRRHHVTCTVNSAHPHINHEHTREPRTSRYLQYVLSDTAPWSKIVDDYERLHRRLFVFYMHNVVHRAQILW